MVLSCDKVSSHVPCRGMGGPVGDGQLGLPFASAHFFLVQKELSVTLSLKAVLQGQAASVAAQSFFC